MRATKATPSARGAQLFGKSCSGCHDNEAYGGAPVPAAQVRTDPALALGHARGTGAYRPPSLLAVGDAAPYLHHGAVASLEDLLSTRRFTAGYVGPLGVGAVVGHAYGTELGEEDRAALVAFLRGL